MIIDVWSDVVCPWCFIGKRRLEKALAQFEHRGDVIVRHRAFQLQPDIKETVPTLELLSKNYGINAAEVREMQSNVCSIADGEGLCYELDNTLSGNTFDAHRLLLWAAGVDKQHQLLEAMYSAYFEKGRSLFSHSDLVSVALEVGIEADVTEEVLLSGKYTEEVIADRKLASQLGASGVPFFVFDMKYGISGAQPLEAFIQTLNSAWEEYDNAIA
ncbi:MAG: DsbA family oxidoreductase [Actinomycetes bacterium]